MPPRSSPERRESSLMFAPSTMSLVKKRLGFALLLTCAQMLLTLPLLAQQQEMPGEGISIDPISFRGPDPAESFSEIYIEQKLGAQVPLDLEFQNEAGETVTLGEYFDGNSSRPVILALVYYSCPSICNLIMNG